VQNKAMKQAGTVAGQSDPAVACAAGREGAFGFMLRHVPYDWRQDAKAAGLLARIAALRAESPPQATIEEDPLGDSLILVGHAGSDADGNDAAW
jgi:hypothetical protein